MPKFNLNWMYMINALMLLGLWWGSDSKGAGSKAVTYSEFQDYVKKGYVSKVLGYEDKSIEAFLKPTAVGAVFGADCTPACLAGCVMDILHAPYERRRQWWPRRRI